MARLIILDRFLRETYRDVFTGRPGPCCTRTVNEPTAATAISYGRRNG